MTAPISRRALIIDNVISLIRLINKQTSPFNNMYTFGTNLGINVKRGVGFIPDDLNNLSAYVRGTTETREYHSHGLTLSKLDCSIIIHARSVDGEANDTVFDAIDDVEHVLYNSIGGLPSQNIKSFSQLGISDLFIDEVRHKPDIEKELYSAEIILNLVYKLNYSRT